MDNNCLSYWFPRLVAAGVPVPKTEILHTDVDLSVILDGKKPPGYDEFLVELWQRRRRLGAYGDAFLRTGHTSGKHDWTRTCFLPAGSMLIDLQSHVFALVEYSAMADMMGLPTDVWAVREFLPLWSTFSAFRGMPIGVERRLFIRDGKLVCDHGYFPPESIHSPSRKDWRALLSDHGEIVRLYDSQQQVAAILEQLRTAFPSGYWSVDVCLCRDGRWYVTDCAEGERSFHWPGCPNAPKEEAEPPRVPLIRRAAPGQPEGKP
jgi:hypothetical protein